MHLVSIRPISHLHFILDKLILAVSCPSTALAVQLSLSLRDEDTKSFYTHEAAGLDLDVDGLSRADASRLADITD